MAEIAWLESVLKSLENPWLESGAILGTSIIVAFLVQLFVTRVLMAIVAKTKTEVDDRTVVALRGPLVGSVVGIGVWYAMRALTPSDGTLYFLRGFLASAVVLSWCRALLGASREVLGSLSREDGGTGTVQKRTLLMFEFLTNATIISAGAYFVFIAWDLDMTGWLASAGVVGIAVGFGAKDSLANLFAGVFILADGPYKIGDYLILSTGDRGRVTDIGLRSTRIQTMDEVMVIVPNSLIGNSEVLNQSGGPSRLRVRIPVGVSYSSDIDQVRRVLLEIASEAGYVLKNPPPQVFFMTMDDSSLGFDLRVWVKKPEERDLAVDLLNTRIFQAFAKEGIEIPFPQRDLNIRNGQALEN